MDYRNTIKELIDQIDDEIIDLSLPREKAKCPTQATSEFIIKNEQGNWAERLVLEAINGNAKNYVAVKYGKADNIIAGDDDFPNFFESYQRELDQIGKRPDILIFRSEDYDEKLGKDISAIEHSLIDNYVKKAVAGIEVRSSSFLIDKYKQTMQQRYEERLNEVFKCKSILMNDKRFVSNPKCKNYFDIVNRMTEENVRVENFKLPSWGNTGELKQIKGLLTELKRALEGIQKLKNLSITPKVEDLKVVYKWIDTFNVPHFYFQVFFDKVYGISFQQILSIVANDQNEGAKYEIGKDVKNQNKTTIKIYADEAACVASKVDEPHHYSKRKELAHGRLIFYVAFKGGLAYLDVDSFKKLLNINGEL